MHYVKVIRASGSLFVREFQKKEKVRKNIKYREVDEKTVAQQFKDGDATVEIFFEDSERDPIVLDFFGDREQIKRYLGDKFL
ncbi:MAG: hypothetical protein A2Y23_05490 [Clostridiales bacterium GWB2_37_7]|nr:MAG: hypothetical protein A2Y23_05490 [Clostridiales bacterium GWB2_37_7]